MDHHVNLHMLIINWLMESSGGAELQFFERHFRLAWWNVWRELSGANRASISSDQMSCSDLTILSTVSSIYKHLFPKKRTKLNLFIHYFNISSNQKVPKGKFERPISLGAYHVNSGSSSKVARTCGSRSKVPVITSYSQLYLTDKHSRSKIFSPLLLIISKRKTFST